MCSKKIDFESTLYINPKDMLTCKKIEFKTCGNKKQNTIKMWKCETCDYSTNREWNLKSHNLTKSHLKKLKQKKEESDISLLDMIVQLQEEVKKLTSELKKTQDIVFQRNIINHEDKFDYIKNDELVNEYWKNLNEKRKEKYVNLLEKRQNVNSDYHDENIYHLNRPDIYKNDFTKKLIKEAKDYSYYKERGDCETDEEFKIDNLCNLFSVYILPHSLSFSFNFYKGMLFHHTKGLWRIVKKEDTEAFITYYIKNIIYPQLLKKKNKFKQFPIHDVLDNLLLELEQEKISNEIYEDFVNHIKDYY